MAIEDTTYETKWGDVTVNGPWVLMSYAAPEDDDEGLGIPSHIDAEHDNGTYVRWEGGPYAEVWPTMNDWSLDMPACDAINVWDYESDVPRIPFTTAALAAEIDRHFSEED